MLRCDIEAPPIDRVTVVAPTTENLSHYQELVEALSNKYKVNVEVRVKIAGNDSAEWNSACYFIKVSAVNHSVSAIFLHLYDGGLCWVF
jgi:hypothetical protein